MTDNSHVFRQLACSDMVRKAAQANHQPILNDGRIDLPMSRIDIGDYLGLTIETVSRTISKLRDMGIVRLRNARSIEIVKPEKLRMLSN